MTFSEEEMAQYQHLSNEYVPETEVIQTDLANCMKMY